MSEPRCECCGLLVASCGKAAEARLRAEQRKRVVDLLARTVDPRYAAAMFPGFCSNCREKILPGQPITRMDIGWVGGLCCGDD